jgi:hypothetical protein
VWKPAGSESGNRIFVDFTRFGGRLMTRGYEHYSVRVIPNPSSTSAKAVRSSARTSESDAVSG